MKVHTSYFYKNFSSTLAILTAFTGIMIGTYNIFHSTPYFIMLGYAFALTALLPPLLWKIAGLKPVWVINVFLYLFVALAFGGGMMLNGYHLLPYYDKFVHCLSGVLFTLIGGCLYFFLKPDARPEKSEGKLHCAFSVFFSLSVGCIWEVIEYVLNIFLHNDPQNVLTTGVNDTMQDLISCMIGSFIVAVFLSGYFKKNKRNFISDIIVMFQKQMLKKEEAN